jgi:hypothetical protein
MRDGFWTRRSWKVSAAPGHGDWTVRVHLIRDEPLGGCHPPGPIPRGETMGLARDVDVLPVGCGGGGQLAVRRASNQRSHHRHRRSQIGRSSASLRRFSGHPKEPSSLRGRRTREAHGVPEGGRVSRDLDTATEGQVRTRSPVRESGRDRRTVARLEHRGGRSDGP